MLFPTLDFALFFVFVFALSWALVKRAGARQWLLIAASYFFYGYWDWRFCFLLAIASFTAWFAGRLMANGDDKSRKLVAIIATAIMLLILAFFKYYGFFLDQLLPLLVKFGFERDLFLLQIILPVGISFFTFQSISYVIDVYRREIEPRKSLADLLLYVSFFPQLVAGPIVRASHFLPQLDKKIRLTKSMMVFGFFMCSLGLFKKMVIANYLAIDLVDPVFFDASVSSSSDLLMATYGYAVQIYCDFSGYSDMAIGTAALLGYRFQANFKQPYRAASIREFWRRWHISLSQWLRDYLYKALGGNRRGTLKTYRNLILTMVLGGLWHGAAWTFILWGIMHGVGLAIERIFSKVGKVAQVFSFKPLQVILTFHFVCIAWILFRSQSLPDAIAFFEGLVQLRGEVEVVTGFSVGLVALGLIFQFTPEYLPVILQSKLKQLPNWMLGVVFAFALLAIDLVSPAGTAPFIYFQF